jgi:hypothetical protein
VCRHKDRERHIGLRILPHSLDLEFSSTRTHILRTQRLDLEFSYINSIQESAFSELSNSVHILYIHDRILLRISELVPRKDRKSLGMN